MRRLLAGDLDNIVLKALRKDPSRRYTSVEQLEADLQRFMQGRPVEARPDTFLYRAGKFVQRNRAVVSVAGLAAIAVVVAMVAIVLGSVRAREAQRVAEAQRNAALIAKSEAQDVLRFFEDMLATANPYRSGQRTTVHQLIEQAEDRIRAELAGKPEVEASVRLAISRTYVSLMDFRQAIPHLRRAIELYRRQRGPLDADLAEALTMLGRALTHQGDADAISVQREALSIRTVVYGDDHPLVAETIGCLGFALWGSVRENRPWTQAEGLYKEAIERLERVGLGRCRDSARLTMSLGYMYFHQGKPREAEACYRRAMNLYAELPVTEDLYEFATLRCYARLLEAERRFDEAATLLRTCRAKLPKDFDTWKRCDITWSLGRLALAADDTVTAARELRE
ncbi:MAG: tetratricopeptide repeat protein, partial [Planctomycetota bacterium]